MNEHIEKAVNTFRTAAPRYAKTERYYLGRHDLAFATKKFENAFGTLFREFAMNMCPAICDALRDKLKIAGFGIEDASRPEIIDEIRRAVGRIWNRNRLALRSGEIHKEVLKNGDAYLIVWPGVDGNAAAYPNRAANVTVAYDEELPGRVVWAAKYWQSGDKFIRLNLFYPDRIETFRSENESEVLLLPEPGSFRRTGEVANPYGVVPVFHFANNADIGQPGSSELDQAIPVQDGLNKSVLDMLVAMEYSAYRQRWAAGIELDQDENGEYKAPFHAGLDHLWIASNPDARFGDLGTADLEQFLKVKESFRIDIACVTGTPLHYLQPSTKGFPSGESLRKAESRFLAKVRDRQESFGQTWADAVAFAYRIETGDSVSLVTEWEDAAAVSLRERLENILLKTKIGLPARRALEEIGYGDEEARSLSK
jgi:hypothetical protein